MLDGKTLKKLRKMVGTQVTENQMVIALEGSKAADVRCEFLRLFRARSVPNTEIKDFSYNGDHFSLISQTVRAKTALAPKEMATTSVRMEAYGSDLLLEIRQFETAEAAKGKRQTAGLLLAILGGMFFWTGIGLAALIGGIVLLASKSSFAEGSPEGRASQLLHETVVETVYTALSNCNVDAELQFHDAK